MPCSRSSLPHHTPPPPSPPKTGLERGWEAGGTQCRAQHIVAQALRSGAVPQASLGYQLGSNVPRAMGHVPQSRASLRLHHVPGARSRSCPCSASRLSLADGAMSGGSDIPERWGCESPWWDHPSTESGSRKPALTWCEHHPSVTARAAAREGHASCRGPEWPRGCRGGNKPDLRFFIKK